MQPYWIPTIKVTDGTGPGDGHTHGSGKCRICFEVGIDNNAQHLPYATLTGGGAWGTPTRKGDVINLLLEKQAEALQPDKILHQR